MAFFQLLNSHIKILYRNWRGLFWNILLPIGLYVGISSLPFTAPGLSQSSLRYSEYLLPGIIAMTILQTGIFGLAYWLVDLNQRGVIKRFNATPLTNNTFLGSLIASRLLMMVLQVVLLIIIGEKLFGAHINGSVVAIIILLVLGGSTFLCIGFFISTISRTYEEASPMTSVVNLLFTFLGNIFYPTAGLSHTLAHLSALLPITYLAEGMRRNFVDGYTLAQSGHYIFALSIWLAILFLIAATTFKIKQSRQS